MRVAVAAVNDEAVAGAGGVSRFRSQCYSVSWADRHLCGRGARRRVAVLPDKGAALGLVSLTVLFGQPS